MKQNSFTPFHMADRPLHSGTYAEPEFENIPIWGLNNTSLPVSSQT